MSNKNDNKRSRRPLLLILLLVVIAVMLLPGIRRNGWLSLGTWPPVSAGRQPQVVIGSEYEGFAAGVKPARAPLVMKNRWGGAYGQVAIWLHNPGTVPVTFRLATDEADQEQDMTIELHPKSIVVKPGHAVKATVSAQGRRPVSGRHQLALEATGLDDRSNTGGQIKVLFPLELTLTTSDTSI